MRSKDNLLFAVTNWSLHRSVAFTKMDSNAVRLTLICALSSSVCQDETIPSNFNCPWKLNAFAGKRSLSKFRITEVGGDHTCSNPTLQSAHKNVTSKFISRFIMSLLK